MNDKQLFKLCLTYVKYGKQPITRYQLIQALEARLKDEPVKVPVVQPSTGTDWK